MKAALDEREYGALKAWLKGLKYWKQDEETKNNADAMILVLEDHEELSQPKSKHLKYQEFVAVYDVWHKQHVGTSPRFNAREGKALKEVIDYLRKESKQSDEEGALVAWQYILSKWTELTPFLQKQVTVHQINKNLTEILTTYRNGSKKQATSTSIAARIKRGLKAK